MTDIPDGSPIMPPLLREGIDLFNKAEFFECHEVLERLWNEQQEPEKQFTQGLIQIAVATYHLQRGNHTGACKLYIRGIKRVSDFQPRHYGVDVTRLVDEAKQLLGIAERSEAIDQLPQIQER